MSYRDRERARNDAAREWRGAYRHYDIVKEATIAFGVVLALAVVLTILFSSPDERPSSIQSWSRSAPVDFVTTALSELDGQSGTAGYGPPYNSASDGQYLAFVHLQKWFGIAHPINPPLDYVIDPLRAVPGQPALQAAVNAYRSASTKMQAAWTAAYNTSLTKATAGPGDSVAIRAGNYGPVPTMMSWMLRLAQTGSLDGLLLRSRQFYTTDYTKILMFLADGGLLDSRAQAEGLLGEQWGMMNETGSYPGQSWLWLYTFWYQIKPFSDPTSVFGANADIYVMAIMTLLSLAFVLVPFIPGVRDLPRWIPIYRLIWREHYRSASPDV
jgi:hypothetical protein